MADDIVIRLCDKLLVEMVTYEKALGQLKVLVRALPGKARQIKGSNPDLPQIRLSLHCGVMSMFDQYRQHKWADITALTARLNELAHTRGLAPVVLTLVSEHTTEAIARTTDTTLKYWAEQHGFQTRVE